MNENESKKTWKERVGEWFEDYKDAILIGGIYVGALGLYLLGVYEGGKFAGNAVDVAEAMMHRDGFLKYFDPSTGEEVSGLRVKELLDTFYNK